MTDRKKIIRTATVPLSLDLFCRGLLRDLSSRYEIIALSSPQPELDSIRKREKVRTISVPMARKIAPFSDLKSLFELIRVFRKERPDMVHSITPKAGLLSMMAARWTRVPVRIHTFTGLIFPYEKGWKRRPPADDDGPPDRLLRHARDSRGRRHPGRPHPLQDHPETPPGPGQRQRAGHRPEPLRPDGKAEPQRGGSPELLQHPRRREPEGKSILDETKEIIDRDDHIHLSDGWQADVRPWYAAADALVHPSRREGFPNVVIEAGAMGLASIVTDINGSREIVKDGQNGTIVPAQDPEAMYAAMKDFLEHPEKVQEMAAAARDLSKRYEQKYVRQCLDVFYREVLR